MEGSPSPSCRTLLAVDDSRLVLQIIRDFFTPRGFEVLEASDGAEALRRLSDAAPDAIVSDVLMPEMDGWSLFHEVRTRPSTADVPFVFLTVEADLPKRLQALRLGADDYLVKPFEVEELHARITRLIERREALRRLPGIEEGWLAGNVDFLSLADLLQLLALNAKDALVRVRRGSESGEIVFERGEMLHAACGRVVGAKALYRILGWKGATFVLGPLPGPPAECTLRGPATQLLMDGLVSLDEWNRWQEQLPPRRTSLHLVRGARKKLREQEMTPAEQEVLARVHPAITLADLLEVSPLPDADLAEAVCTLRERGVLDFRVAGDGNRNSEAAG